MNADARPPLLAVALLSGAALGYEVLLTRLLAIIQWHHFAHMIISLGLLGYGASGTFLALTGRRWQGRFLPVFAVNALLFGLTAVAAFLIAQQLPFNPLEIAWDRRQLGYLLALYLILAVPFFCVANALGLALMAHTGEIARIYAWDLLGAGVGACAVVGLLWLVPPLAALQSIGVLGAAAALLAVWEYAGPRRWLALTGLAVVLPLLLPVTGLQLSPYKDLTQALTVKGAAVVAERSGPLGWVRVVDNDTVALRHAPGLSLTSPALPPEQLGLYVDGGLLGTITRLAGEPGDLDYLDWQSAALPYHLINPGAVLVLGAGGGAEVLRALYHDADTVTAVELNPEVVELLRGPFAGFAGGLYDRPDVEVVIDEARSFVAGNTRRYELIQVALLDAFGTGGLHALNESTLYTVEALEEYLAHLAPGGLLAFTRWLRIPPRDGLKLLLTAATALERTGVADPGERLLMIRGWKTTTLVVGERPFTAAQIQALKDFGASRGFDLVWYPGIDPAEANRRHRLEDAPFYRGARALLGPGRADFLEDYKFDLHPATDDRPYYFHFFRWRTLPELLGLAAGGGLAQLEWGYLVLVATLIQALLAGLVLILLPLLLGGQQLPGGRRGRVFGYFGAIGLAFLFLEIAMIQKFMLFLGHPLTAVAVVLAGFLVFAGLGSGVSRQLDPARHLWPVMAGIGVLGVSYLWLLPALFGGAMAWPLALKIALALTLIAPLAFLMGMPFPLGLERVAGGALLPWAWGINGCASVVSAVLAVLLAMAVGFDGVVVLAVGLYGVAGASLPRG